MELAAAVSVTLAVFAHNSVTRLLPTLSHLSRLSNSHAFELLLVDNASVDGTAQAAQEIWRRLTDSTLEVVTESRLGLSYAREAAMDAASGDIIVYVDDDNWLEPNYVNRIVAIFDSCPSVGAAGGRAIGEYEINPPGDLAPFLRYLAIGGGGDRVNAGMGEVQWLWGAGLALRRTAVENLRGAGFRSWLSDRKGKKLSSGGDVELTLALRLLGYQLVYDDDLVLHHYMPKGRLNRRYFQKLVNGHGRSSVVHAFYYSLLQPDGVLTSAKWRSLARQRLQDLVNLCRAQASSGEWRTTAAVLERSAALGRLQGTFEIRDRYGEMISNLEDLARNSKSLRLEGAHA